MMSLSKPNMFVFVVFFSTIILLLTPVFLRLYEIHAATEKTKIFCRSVALGDNIEEVLEEARTGAWILAAAINGSSSKSADSSFPDSSQYGDHLNVIYEDRELSPGWPRYLIWTGPLYHRVYCGLEQDTQGRVKAKHFGPIDDETIDFFENWFEDWVQEFFEP